MPGLKDFLQSPGAMAIGGGLAGLAGGSNSAGPQNIMAGLQAVQQQKQENAMIDSLRSVFQPPAPSANSEAAGRQTVPHGEQMRQYKIINALLEGRDIPGALKQYMGLQEMMKPDYKTVSANQSIYNAGTGEIGDQAPDAPISPYEQGRLDVAATEVDAQIAAKEAELGIKREELSIDRSRAEAYGEAEAGRAAYYQARAVVEAAKNGGTVDTTELTQSLAQLVRDETLRMDDPELWQYYVDWHKHLLAANKEALGLPTPSLPDDDSTQEGVPIQVPELTPYSGATVEGTRKQGGVTYYNPATDQFEDR